MDIETINQKLALGEIDTPQLFPHLTRLETMPYTFQVDFGLKELPTEPGILLIRGARQYGKSTWLEQKLRKTIEQYGPGTAYYLNGENIVNSDMLVNEIDVLTSIFAKGAAIKRLFIDEITAIPEWEIALKKLADSGKLATILVITTGSKATDLRRGAERLPGRKGKLPRTTYLFTPISYQEFHRTCSETLGKNTLNAYLLSGGSPIACAELAAHEIIPEYVIELVRDWIEGEVTASGRSRSSLMNILSVMFRLGSTATGQAKLAREAGLANNTVAHGYIELLNDLACIVPTYPWDQHRQLLILRKPCKYHFTNLLSAVAYHPARIRTLTDFIELPHTTQGLFYEWVIAQELLRRTAIQSTDILQPLAFWQNKKHEIDFVASPDEFIEVKYDHCSAVEFAWFTKQFPGKQLTIINKKTFETDHIKGVTLEEFLLNQHQD